MNTKPFTTIPIIDDLYIFCYLHILTNSTSKNHPVSFILSIINNFINMINKFHKTAYPKNQHYNLIHSSQSKRTTNQPTYPLQHPVEIQSSLFLKQKNQKEISRPIQTSQQKTSNRSEMKFYETSSGFISNHDRPQSKQEPRPKNNQSTEIKGIATTQERPQTSKGLRQTRTTFNQVKARQISQNDEQFPVQIKMTQKKERKVQSSYSRKDSKAIKILNFETSIDPQFLCLFAN